MAIDVNAIALVQNTFIHEFEHAFPAMTQYGLNLLYLFAAFEFVIFGLLWALKVNADLGDLLFKIIKIGLIFFVVQHLSSLINIILSSFFQIGRVLSGNKESADFMFNPALLWQYGYDSSISLLKSAAQASSVGLSFTQVFLGLGILCSFMLISIAMVFQVAAFYLVALMSLIFLPLGVFSPTRNMSENALRAILKSGLKLCVLSVVVSASLLTYHFFKLDKSPIGFSINEAIGLLSISLLFASLALFLPRVVASVVGQFSWSSFPESHSTSIQESGGFVTAASAGLDNMQAATLLPSSGTASSTPSISVTAQAATLSQTSSAQTFSFGNKGSRKQENNLEKAREIKQQDKR